ncbi:MAG TPA: hypothetical protein VKZ51_06105, partial [Cyclobacteriaceae bacterium]|nr:hypothetical protein [Cyclobacteriaceae bacterium]
QKESPEKLSASRRRDRNLPKTIEIIKIDTVEAEDAKFNLGYRENGHDLELINSGVNLSFYDFFLDSAILEDGDIASFFSNMSMEIDKFSLALRDSIHTVNFSKVTLDTKSEEIVFDDFTVIPNDLNGKRGLPVVDAQVPKVSLKTRSLTNLQRTGDLLVKELVLLRPEIMLYMDQEQDTRSNGDKEEQLTPDFLKSLSISDFIIRDGSLVLKDKSQAKAMNSFQNLSITLHDLHFDLAAAGALNQKFYLNKDFEFELSDYEVKLPDSLNLLRIGSALLSQDNLKLRDVSFVPRYGPYAYSRKVGHQTDVAEVEVPEIILEGINVEKLLGDNTIEAKIARLSNAHALVFRDKRQPLPAEIHKGMPQELMMKGILEVKLDSLIVENAEVIYREFPEQGLIPGELLFSEMDATMSPFYVLKDPDQYPHERSRVWAEALLNGQAPMNLHAELFYQPPFPIQVKVGVGHFELPMLNSILKPNVFVSVLDGVIQGGRWQFIADENVAMGSMTICYNDLQLRLLDERTLKRGTGRKGVLTFVINNLAVRSNNPRKLFNRLVEGSIYEERDKSRFIFNYLWKATLSGLKGTAGLGQAKPPKSARD